MNFDKTRAGLGPIALGDRIYTRSACVLAIFGNPGEGVLIGVLVLLAVVLLAGAIYAVRHRGKKRWWQGPNGPKDERFVYQRRDDSGQG